MLTVELKRMRQLIGTSADWTANDLVIGDGEIAIVREVDGALGLRVGDGLKRFSELPDIGVDFVTVIEGDGVIDTSAAIAAANAAGNTIVFQGLQVIGTPTTITVPIADTFEQIFAPGAQVTIDNGLPVRPEWFGSTAGNIKRAVDALPNAGGVVQLADKTYPPSYNTATGAMFNDRSGTPGTDYMVRKRVRIQGTKLPEYNAGETAMQNGTIVQGPFYVSCECDGFELDRVGIDSGTAVVTALYGGLERDAFGIVQVNKAAPLTGTDFHIGSVRGLCMLGATGAHAVLIEAINGATLYYAEGRHAYHGTVIKSRNMKIGSLVGHANAGEDVILKSDTYAVCSELEIGAIVGSGQSAAEPGITLLINAGTANLSSIQIGRVLSQRKDWGLVIIANAGFIIADTNIADLLAQSCAAGGYQLNGDCRRIKVATATLNATPTGVYVTANAVERSNTIDELSIANATAGVDCSGKINIAKAHFDTVTTALVYSAGGATIFIGSHTETSVGNFWMLQPALANSWASHPGGDAFKTTLENGKVVMSGLLQGGTAVVLTAALDVRIRPNQNYRFGALAFNGTTPSIVEVVVTTAGTVGLASSIAAASAYLSLSGVEWPIPF